MPAQRLSRGEGKIGQHEANRPGILKGIKNGGFVGARTGQDGSTRGQDEAKALLNSLFV